jgi:fructose-1,6-bisphosphatase/inositol monophosphatase family enzyme
VSVVANLASGARYHAVRGAGAWRGTTRVVPSGCASLREAVVAISGMPSRHLGWAQFRAFGAAALELCAVADGTIDAFVVGTHAALAPWDYLGAMLVCEEAGAAVGELQGRGLVTKDHGARREVVAAATTALFGQLAAVASPVVGSDRSGGSPGGDTSRPVR